MKARKRSRGRIAALVVTLVVVGGSAVPTYASAAHVLGGARRTRVSNTKFLGVVPSRRGRAVPHVSRPAQLLYGGGPVQHSSAVYAIFWTPGAYALPTGYADLVSQYFTDVSHDSSLTSNVYASDTQYFDAAAGAKRFVSYSSAYRGAIVDTDPLPADGCPNYVISDRTTSNNCITDAQIETEIKSVVAARQLPSGLASEYFVFLPSGLASCFERSGLARGDCYAPLTFDGYCAYHSSTTTTASAVLYAVMPYAAIAGCASGESPNANPADAVLDTVSHEHNETITDPLGDAWADQAGNENGDKCEASYGAALGATASGRYNQVINGHDYWLQREWSNRARACVARNAFPQPTASFGYAPARPVAGTKVAFTAKVHDRDDTKFTYQWTFPDGSTSTRPNPVFVMRTSGPQPVELVVTDAHGDQTNVGQTVNVG